MARLIASIVGILGLFATYVGLTTALNRHASGRAGMRGLSHPDLYGTEAIQYGLKWLIPGLIMVTFGIARLVWCVRNDVE